MTIHPSQLSLPDKLHQWLRRAWFREFLVLPLVLLVRIYLCNDVLLFRFPDAPGVRISAALMNWVATYFIWDAARSAYAVMLMKGKPHTFFWMRFAIALGASAGLMLIIGFIPAFILTGVAAYLVGRSYNEAPPPQPQRPGETISDLSTARNAYPVQRGEANFLLGDVYMPLKEASHNIALVGTVGSGKTVNLKLLMQSILPGIGVQPNGHRAVVYDPNPNGEDGFYSYLEALGIPGEHILVMNPFDRRCRPWDMAADIITPTDAETLAEILVPAKKGSKDDDFWRTVTVRWIKATVRYFNYHAEGQWRFRDVLLAVRNPAILNQICEDERLKHYVYLWGSDRTAQSIMATILGYMERYEPIAALWHNAEKVYQNKPISLTTWVNESSVLLLGRHETARTQMRELNRIILERLMQLIIGKSGRHSPDTFFFLDEFGSLGEMSAIVELSTEGRKKGSSLIVGFQAESQLRENYGDQQCNTILGQFNHIMALRLNDAQTAGWLSDRLGEIEVIRYTRSVTRSFMEGTSETISESIDRPKLLMPSELTGIQHFSPQHGIPLKGFILGARKNWWFQYAPNIIHELIPPINEADNFLPAPGRQQELALWDAEDYRRLKLRPPDDQDNPPQGGSPSPVPKTPNGGASGGEVAASHIDWEKFYREQGML